jgi:hypothetical protein
MVKKTSRKNSSEAAAKPQEKKVQEVVEEVELYESDLVKLKKENAKVLEKSISKMEGEIKKNLDSKQVVLAAKALQKVFKSKKTESQKKQLLQDEDSSIHVTFTLSKVPERPTPRPMQVSVPAPFNSSKFDTRICVIVKDPESDFRK